MTAQLRPKLIQSSAHSIRQNANHNKTHLAKVTTSITTTWNSPFTHRYTISPHFHAWNSLYTSRKQSILCLPDVTSRSSGGEENRDFPTFRRRNQRHPWNYYTHHYEKTCEHPSKKTPCDGIMTALNTNKILTFRNESTVRERERNGEGRENERWEMKTNSCCVVNGREGVNITKRQKMIRFNDIWWDFMK